MSVKVNTTEIPVLIVLKCRILHQAFDGTGVTEPSIQETNKPSVCFEPGLGCGGTVRCHKEFREEARPPSPDSTCSKLPVYPYSSNKQCCEVVSTDILRFMSST
jgi:hypothetical protein